MPIGDSVTAGVEDLTSESELVLTLDDVQSPEFFPNVFFTVENNAVSGGGLPADVTVRIGSPDGQTIDLGVGTVQPGDSVSDNLSPGFTPSDGVIGVAFSPDNDFIPDFATNQELEWALNVETTDPDEPDDGGGGGDGDDGTDGSDDPTDAPDADDPVDTPDGTVYSLPFSILNAAPWVQGVEDFDITVPQTEDIESLLDQIVPNIAEIGNIVEAELNTFDFPEPPSLPDIRAEIDDALAGLDIPSLPDIRAEVDEALAELNLPEVPTLDEIVDGVSQEVDALVQDVQAALSDVEAGVDQTVASAERGLQDTLSSVSADLSDVQETLSGAVDDIQADIQGVQETLDEFETPDVPTAQDIADAVVDQIEPEINDVGLFEDPVGFAGELVAEGIDRQVSNETAERLSERVND